VRVLKEVFVCLTGFRDSLALTWSVNVPEESMGIQVTGILGS
jgi:hypothetical protein